MYIQGIHVPDHLYQRLDEHQKSRVDQIILELDQNLGPLDRSMKDIELRNILQMEPEEQKLSKKERRKLMRQKRREKAKATNVEQETPTTPEKTEPEFTPLDQMFGDGKLLSQVLDPEIDVYLKERRTKVDKQIVTEKRWLIRRDAIRKIADAGGIVSFTKTVVFSPSIDNNFLVGFDVTVTDGKGKTTTMLGEASNENTRGISKMYKALTAERRGYVRAVLTHLGLRNLYGEDEFVEEEVDLEEDQMPSKEEFEGIEKHINAILNATSKEDLSAAGDAVKASAETLSDKQMNYLRELYKKYLTKFESI